MIQRVGVLTPYSGYPATNTLINAVRPYPQFSTIAVTDSPTGSTYYDSLQMKGTKRMSHGLQVNGTFTWSKAMMAIRPNLFVPSDKSMQPPISHSCLTRTFFTPLPRRPKTSGWRR